MYIFYRGKICAYIRKLYTILRHYHSYIIYYNRLIWERLIYQQMNDFAILAYLEILQIKFAHITDKVLQRHLSTESWSS